MAVGRNLILKVAITLATVVLVTVLFRVFALHLLPPRQLVLSQLFVRMRDVFAFLAFTTVIAVGIFSSQHKDRHKDVESNNTRRNLFLEHHPLGAIFGETENDHGTAEADLDALAPVLKQMQMNNSDDTVVDYSIERAPAAVVKGSLLQKRSAWLDMETSGVHEFSMTNLHRKASSLDGSGNHEPDFEATALISPDHTPPPRSISAKSKPVKRVSFLYPSPSLDEALDDSGKQLREQTPEKQKAATPLSPGDITMQADAFIAKFKEQMRMQWLESLYRRQRRDRK